ncbi:MAG TPA: TonB-dependent receptor [Allosphingosinicella sp.]|nr:TonB-dependent receptor [Allosphingosinicella sp.]
MSSKTSLKTRLRIGGAMIALAAFASPAFAQDAPVVADADLAATDANDEVITVTARRRAESLIDVPIAVSAYSGEQLDNEGALDLTDIADTTPNVTIEASRGTNSTLTVFIRGVGQQDPVAGFEAGVGLYLDDVYMNRPQGALLDIYDVERIEVLRGPQGTLYGRNTIGGAIKYVTRRLPADPALGIRGTVGTYQQADLVLTASTPVTEDRRLRVGGAFARLSRGGFGDNLTTGLENYNKDVWAGRLSAEYNNGGTAFVRLQGDYTADDSNPRGGHRLIPGIASGTPVLADVYDSRGALLDPTQRVRAWGVSLYAEAQPWDGWTLRSITAYRRDRSGTPIDFDALPSVNVDVPAVYRNHQTSQEVQILYNRGGFNALVGAYYLDANGVTIFDVRLPGGVTALTFGDVDTETYAVFGDFSYDFASMFSISLGGRYTWDERGSRVLRQTFLGGGSPFFGGGGTLFATTSNFTGTANFEKFTPRASVSFHPAENQNLYASWSRGFKGGGFDPRGVTTACRTPTGVACNAQQIYDFMSFDPETVTSYELGYRAALFDRRVNLSFNILRQLSRRPGAGLDRHRDQRPADLHRHHHQCRPGALPGRRVRGQCDRRPRLRQPGGFAELLLGIGLSRRRLSRVHRCARHRRRQPAADPEHAALDGERHAELRHAGGRRHAQRDHHALLPEREPAVRAAHADARPAGLRAVGREPGLALERRPLVDRAARPQPHQQALHRLGLQFPVAEPRHRRFQPQPGDRQLHPDARQ